MAGEFIIDNNGVMPVMDGGYIPLVNKNGIGDCVCCAGPLLIWMVIDEDEAAYGGYTNQGYCGCYEEQDTKQLRELYDKYPILMGTTVCNRVQSAGDWRVHARPPGVRFRDWARPPTLETLKSDFRSDIQRFAALDAKIYFYTIVDNSGSMTTATVQPGWNQFLTWLNNDFSKEDERFVQVHSTSSGFPERWILFIQTPMNSYIQESGIRLQTSGIQSAILKSEARSLMPAIPGTHDIAAWREYRGPWCRWMHDTGVAAMGNCLSNLVECTHPDCPVSQSDADGNKPLWKTRFCNPENCRYFEWPC